MPNENNQPSIVSSQVLDLKDMISGPLLATIDADAMSARRYMDYMLELAFQSYNHDTGTAGPLRMLEFAYQAMGDDGMQTRTVSIPLITLMPLPLLHVQEADFDFDMQIVEALQTNARSALSLREPDAVRPADDTRLRVAMASREAGQASSASRNVTANMKVSVRMRQADMPDGLSKFLYLASSNMIQQKEK